MSRLTPKSAQPEMRMGSAAIDRGRSMRRSSLDSAGGAIIPAACVACRCGWQPAISQNIARQHRIRMIGTNMGLIATPNTASKRNSSTGSMHTMSISFECDSLRFTSRLSIRCGHNDTRRSRSAFPTTERELRLMAALAQMGVIRMPKKGYSRPAATGTLSAL